ncbi:MAG: glyoxalase/bleomycin resistance/extradiol dioxygenase family protein [Gemmatimonas sp.]|nr:glyoxalase/bleomycin resistance/extradiol dioxygenase family protein [Gemmatimonas sp.]
MHEPTGLEVRGVLETCLYAEELEASAGFYERVLRLRAVSRLEGRHVFFRCGSGMFLLFDPNATQTDGGEVPPHGARGPGHVAFAVGAAELGSWRVHLEREGVPVEADVTWPSGGTSLYLRDPAGNSVELTTPTIWSIPEEDGLIGRPEADP